MYEFLSPAEHKKKIFLKKYNWLVDIDFHIMKKKKNIYIYILYTLWKSMATVICLVTNILQNLFCVQQLKEIHTWEVPIPLLFQQLSRLFSLPYSLKA